MFNKRGISDIVATILIVLLALAAVAIIWAFVQPMLRGTGGAATLSAKCLQTEVKPTNCVINTTSNTSSVNVQLVKAGASKVSVVLEDVTGAAITGTEVTAPGVLATTAVSVEDISTLDTTGDVVAKGIAIVSDEEGNSQMCSPSTIEYTCSIVT